MTQVRRSFYVCGVLLVLSLVAWALIGRLPGLLKSQEASAYFDPGAPRPITELLVAEWVTSQEMAIVARFFGAPEYWVLPDRVTIVSALTDSLSVVGIAELDDGTVLHLGDEVRVGDSVVYGLFNHRGSEAFTIRVAEGEYGLVEIEPRSMIALASYVIDAEVALTVPCASSVGDCGEGYYACCQCTAVGARCRCRIDALPATPCQAGGQHAGKCSITCSGDPCP